MKLNWRPIVFSLAIILPLGACSTLQSFLGNTNVASDVANACTDAETIYQAASSQLHGGALNTANSIGTYITSACSTAQAIAQVAQNSGTVQWLGQMIGQLQALISGTPTTTT